MLFVSFVVSLKITVISVCKSFCFYKCYSWFSIVAVIPAIFVYIILSLFYVPHVYYDVGSFIKWFRSFYVFLSLKLKIHLISMKTPYKFDRKIKLLTTWLNETVVAGTSSSVVNICSFDFPGAHEQFFAYCWTLWTN